MHDGPHYKPELLAPAGGWEQAEAAVKSGADAIYFGLQDFNARARAANFDIAEVPRLMSYLHLHGVQGFVAFNTLVFDEELDRASERLVALSEAGVDALIVQDLGVVQLAQALAPDLPIHASTQCTVTSAEGADYVHSLGVCRVVLGRELSVKDIAHIAAHTDVELEVFVHGALCVSYSGQCFSSEAWGGRSANRGQCAQTCRLPYDLILDGQPKDMGPHKYLLSPQDLVAIDLVPELVAAGVSCFKIEGRMKGPEYVALTTRAYRTAIDAAVENKNLENRTDVLIELEQIYSRGATPGFLAGTRHQVLVEGKVPRHRGLRVGTVVEVRDRSLVLDVEHSIRAGDGLAIEPGAAMNADVGGAVFQVREQGDNRAEVSLHGDVELATVKVGDSVWRTKDPLLNRRIKSELRRPEPSVPISARVEGAEGQPLTVVYTDSAGRTGEARSEALLAPASKRPLDVTSLTKQLDRLGDTPFAMTHLASDLEGDLFLPMSELNAVRRAAAGALAEARQELGRHDVADDPPGVLGRLLRTASKGQPVGAQLSVLCRTPDQVRAVIEETDVQTVILDYLEVKGVGEGVRWVQEAGREAVMAAPRILKHLDERIWKFIVKCRPDGILVRSPGLLETLRRSVGEVPSLYGDFSLNVANGISARQLLDMGLARLAPTHDLNGAQICGLTSRVEAERIEVTIHHHLPIFHTEHCVFARFLSDGNDFRDCGHPCEQHALQLRDLEGREHTVLADMGCRNTVFNASAQSGARWIDQFLAAGIAHFRVELLDHSAEQVGPLVARYQACLDGGLQSDELWRWLGAQPGGVTEGSLATKAGEGQWAVGRAR